MSKSKKHSEHYDAVHYAKCTHGELMATLMLARLSQNRDDKLVAMDCLNELRRRKFGDAAMEGAKE